MKYFNAVSLYIQHIPFCIYSTSFSSLALYGFSQVFTAGAEDDRGVLNKCTILQILNRHRHAGVPRCLTLPSFKTYQDLIVHSGIHEWEERGFARPRPPPCLNS